MHIYVGNIVKTIKGLCCEGESVAPWRNYGSLFQEIDKIKTRIRIKSQDQLFNSTKGLYSDLKGPTNKAQFYTLQHRISENFQETTASKNLTNQQANLIIQLLLRTKCNIPSTIQSRTFLKCLVKI